jgi:hypothetical protein
MILPGVLTGYYYLIPILAGIFIILCIFRIRHMFLDIHRTRQGLQQFFTCHGKERWGPPARVKDWQHNAIRHLIAQRETLENDTWQMKNRRNNLAEMEQEEQKKLSELGIAEQKAQAADDKEKSLFIEFEISRNKAKTEDLRNRIQEKDIIIRSMEQALQRANKCLKSYSGGKNPRLPVSRYILGLFFDLR